MLFLVAATEAATRTCRVILGVHADQIGVGLTAETNGELDFYWLRHSPGELAKALERRSRGGAVRPTGTHNAVAVVD